MHFELALHFDFKMDVCIWCLNGFYMWTGFNLILCHSLALCLICWTHFREFLWYLMLEKHLAQTQTIIFSLGEAYQQLQIVLFTGALFAWDCSKGIIWRLFHFLKILMNNLQVFFFNLGNVTSNSRNDSAF